jgi:hypothetical protein
MSAIILFDVAAINPAPATFALGLFSPPAPAQQDNTVPTHKADGASIDEQTAWSIARTIAEEAASRGVEQEDNVTEFHPADAASIDEITAHSISLTLVREEADRRERIMEIEAAKSVYFDRYAAIEAEAEEAELAAKYDAVCYA